MKTQTQFLIIVGLLMLALGGAFYVYSNRNLEPLPAFSATIKYDCAPWDGTAFTVAIPIDVGVIAVSIYQSPELRFPERFSFPDKSGRIGNALLLSPVGGPDELSGKISFQSVARSSPVEGEFDLRTGTGRQFIGRFVAEWESEFALCG